jgi:hypothetical protein
MADLARLGLAVDSTQVEKGTVSLHQLSGAAGQAAAAARNLAGASQTEAAGQRAATTATVAHTAALNTQQTVLRSTMQQRTMMVYQLNDIAVSLASGMNPAMVALQQGSQILQGGFAPALRTITDLVGGLVTKFWPVAAAVGLVSAALAGLTYEINKTADVQVGFFDVALAGWQLFAEGVASLVAPVFGAIGSWLQTGWDMAAPVLKGIGNTLIATFIGAFDASKAAWAAFPSVMGEIAFATARNVVSGVESMINGAVAAINNLIRLANNIPNVDLPEMGDVSFGALENPYEGSMQGAAGQVVSSMQNAFQVDYLGGMFDALSARAQEIAATKEQVDALGGSAKAANDNIKGMTDSLANIGPATLDPLTLAAQQLANLEAQLAQGKISWEQYGEAAFRANSGAAAGVLGLAGQMTGALAQMFQDNKAFAVANAVVSTAEAVMKALATYGPTPWGFAAAGVAAATGAAQIGTILSAQKGSASRPSGPKSSGAPSGGQAAAPQRATMLNITLGGAGLYTRDNMREMLEQLADGLNEGIDGGRFKVAVNS